MAGDAGNSSPKLGKVAQPSLIPVHLRARKACGLTGASNKWLYCVCPAGVQARASVMGTAPRFRGGMGDLASVAPPGASVLCRQTWGHFPQLSPSSSHKSEPQVRAECAAPISQGEGQVWIPEKCKNGFCLSVSSTLEFNQPQVWLHQRGANL